MATWVIISGSPYGKGKCQTAARAIETELRHSHHETVRLFSCASLSVHGCIGCDRCKGSFTCIYDDDQTDLMTALDEADKALIVSPIYFAGVPSQFKAVLDRFQPYFWKRQGQLIHDRPLPSKRPLYVALVGEGGDPYGSDPALAQIASPFALADFALCSSNTFIRADVDQIITELEALIRPNEQNETCKEGRP